MLSSSILMLPFDLKCRTKIARPIPISAAAIPSTKIAKSCPIILCKTVENEIKLMFAASKIISDEIKIPMTDFLLNKIPNIPIENNKNERMLYCKIETDINT